MNVTFIIWSIHFIVFQYSVYWISQWKLKNWLTFYTELRSYHDQKIGLCVLLAHVHEKFHPIDTYPLTQRSSSVSRCYNRARKYSVSFLLPLSVRTSLRYDLTSWSSWPLWWNAVIQDMWEAKGSWTLPTFVT